MATGLPRSGFRRPIAGSTLEPLPVSGDIEKRLIPDVALATSPSGTAVGVNPGQSGLAHFPVSRDEDCLRIAWISEWLGQDDFLGLKPLCRRQR